MPKSRDLYMMIDKSDCFIPCCACAHGVISMLLSLSLRITCNTDCCLSMLILAVFTNIITYTCVIWLYPESPYCNAFTRVNYYSSWDLSIVDDCGCWCRSHFDGCASVWSP